MKNSRLIYWGFLSIIGFCLSSALARVYISKGLRTYDPFALCFYTFSIGTIFFAICNVKSVVSGLYKKCTAHYSELLQLNISSMGSWLFLVYPLKYIEPSIVSTITFGAGPVFSYFIQWFIVRKVSFKMADVTIIFFIVIILLYIIYLVLFVFSTNISLFDKLSSLICCFIVAICMVINRIQTRKLIDLNFSPFDMLTLRFVILIIIALLITISKNKFVVNMFLNSEILTISFYFVILPLFLMQIAQKYLEPVTIAMTAPLMPIATFLFEFYNVDKNDLKNNLYLMLPSILSLLICVIIGSYFRYKQEVKTIGDPYHLSK